MSLDFSSTQDFASVDLGAANTFGGNFTLCCWVKIADWPASELTALGIYEQNTDDRDGSVLLGSSSTDNRVFARIYDNPWETAEASSTLIASAGDLDSGSNKGPFGDGWLPIMIYGEGAGTGFRNQSRVATQMQSGGQGAPGFANTAYRYLTLGGRMTDTANWTGKVAYAAYFDGALGYEERAAFCGGANPLDLQANATLLAYYPCDENSATQTDQSGNSAPSMVFSGNRYSADMPKVRPPLGTSAGVFNTAQWNESVSNPAMGPADVTVNVVVGDLVYLALGVDAATTDTWFDGITATINSVGGDEILRIDPGANTQGLIIWRWHASSGNRLGYGDFVAHVSSDVSVPSGIRNHVLFLIEPDNVVLGNSPPNGAIAQDSGSQSSISVASIATQPSGFVLGFSEVNTYADQTSDSPQTREVTQEHVGAGGSLVCDTISPADISTPTDAMGWTISASDRTAAAAFCVYARPAGLLLFDDFMDSDSTQIQNHTPYVDVPGNGWAKLGATSYPQISGDDLQFSGQGDTAGCRINLAVDLSIKALTLYGKSTEVGTKAGAWSVEIGESTLAASYYIPSDGLQFTINGNLDTVTVKKRIGDSETQIGNASFSDLATYDDFYWEAYVAPSGTWEFRVWPVNGEPDRTINRPATATLSGTISDIEILNGNDKYLYSETWYGTGNEFELNDLAAEADNFIEITNVPDMEHGTQATISGLNFGT